MPPSQIPGPVGKLSTALREVAYQESRDGAEYDEIARHLAAWLRFNPVDWSKLRELIGAPVRR